MWTVNEAKPGSEYEFNHQGITRRGKLDMHPVQINPTVYLLHFGVFDVLCDKFGNGISRNNYQTAIKRLEPGMFADGVLRNLKTYFGEDSDAYRAVKATIGNPVGQLPNHKSPASMEDAWGKILNVNAFLGQDLFIRAIAQKWSLSKVIQTIYEIYNKVYRYNNPAEMEMVDDTEPDTADRLGDDYPDEDDE